MFVISGVRNIESSLYINPLMIPLQEPVVRTPISANRWINSNLTHLRLELVVPVTTEARGELSAVLQIFGAEKNVVKPRID